MRQREALANIISAEYAGDTLRQAQLAKAFAARLSATPMLDTVFKLCPQAHKHLPVLTDDTRKTLIENGLKTGEVRTGEVPHGRSELGRATTVMASSMQRGTNSLSSLRFMLTS